MLDPYASWSVVQLKPNSEAIAIRNLERQGFSVFAPHEYVQRRRGGKLVRLRIPLFPGYLFVGLQSALGEWRQINSTSGVSRLISFNGKDPAIVPGELLRGLMGRCDESGELVHQPRLAIGDEVTVVDGPLTEFIGWVERIDSEQRVWVLLDLLGKNTKVALSRSDLRRAS
ncbi:MAG: transcriptional activator RfaH [Sphingomonadaceae bacterium]|nr:transcriptional activator RfaH [Sphingomonadaceae bacterium]